MKAILEKISVGETRSISSFFYDHTRFATPWHFHPEFELTYIVKSHGIRYVGNHAAGFEPGELVLLGSNLPHCWKNTHLEKGPAQSYVIQWDPSIFADIPELENIHSLLAKSFRGIIFDSGTSERALPQMQSLLAANKINQYLILIQLLNELSHTPVHFLAGESYAYDLNLETGKRLDKIQSYIKTYYNKKITLNEMAELVNMTEQSFSRFFSKTMQRPFFEFLNEYRINLASRMLIETDMQIAEIGYACGYETLPFFYKQFKKFKSTTPLTFRKLYNE